MSEFMTTDQVKTGMTFRQMLVALWPYARRHPWILFWSSFSVVGVAVSSRMMPNIIGHAIDDGIMAHDSSALQYAAYAFLCVEIANSLFQFVSQYMFNWFGNRMLFYIREELHAHTQRLPLNYFNKTPLGRTVTRLTNDTATLGEVFTDGLINLVTSGVVILSIVVAMLLISVKLTLVTMALAPVFIYASYQITQRIRVILRLSKQKLSILNSYIAENLNGIKVIQLFYRVSKNQKKFEKLSRDYRDVTMRSVKSYAFLQPVMNLFNAVTVTAALYYGGILGQENVLALGAIVAFLMHAQDFIHPLREILEKYQQFQNSLTSAERVFQLLDEKPEAPDASGALAHSAWKGQVSIKNLSFRYAPELPEVLKNINLEIEPGTSVAIVGRTGSGKTTFISLLQRFYEPPTNSIYIDGRAVENFARSDLRARLGVVQQDNFIFRGNISDNVSLGDPSIPEERIRGALEHVGYLTLLARSGRSMDSKVEEKGANLSVGERQLIAFARIIAFSPEILILDEATANIDSESELLIQKATQKIIKDRTSIIIAHRLSTIRECNKIVVMDGGQIMEMGSHHELLAKKGLYAQLAEAGTKDTLTVALSDGTELPLK